VTPERIRSGSDLKALPPRQLLGRIIGLRGRYWRDLGIILGDSLEHLEEAQRDHRLALDLFPQSFVLQRDYQEISNNLLLFERSKQKARPLSGKVSSVTKSVGIG
jgi:hypothetical protein